MAFIPTTLQPNTRVLWQPVIVQNLQTQNTEQLRRQNQFLKRQLELVLKINPSGQGIDQPYIQQHTNTDRFQSFTSNNANLSRRPSENAYYSPRLALNNHRLSQNQSPPLKSLLTPNQSSNLHQRQNALPMEDYKIKRMVISKGKDGRYYRDRFQEMQQSYINELSRTNVSKFTTPQTSLRSSPFTTPHRTSNQLHQINKSKIQEKPTISRLNSPSFLKNKHKDNISQDTPDFMRILTEKIKETEDHPTFKRSPITYQECNIIKGEQQIQNDFVYEKIRQKERKQTRIPTLELSCQCDSALSIERKLRQIKKQKKQKKKSNFDQFLQQIEQNLQTMYGKQ